MDDPADSWEEQGSDESGKEDGSEDDVTSRTIDVDQLTEDSSWQASASWKAAVSKSLSSLDSGYSTVTPQAPPQHSKVQNIFLEPSPGAEDRMDEQSQSERPGGPGSHPPGSQTGPGAVDPAKGGAGPTEPVPESEGHREFQTPVGGHLEEVHDGIVAEASSTTATGAGRCKFLW
ncbi:hypothetical protein JZ751_021469 [Albula glossodonta]|uniref:Uncharacterized protein n=1 Tax=Albula glossodonta TaxID=121402 RepID=A0A8T2NL07_9TELE|nr:hypothetical protein JZ751_021469 [Albula glossodonta]